MNKPFGQLNASFQPILEQYIKDLKSSFDELHGNAVRLLGSLRVEEQTELALPSAASDRPAAPNGAQNGGGTLLNTQIIEHAIQRLERTHFSVVDVKNLLRNEGTNLQDDQISTAFRKLAGRVRPESPIEKFKPGAGTSPTLYRLKKQIP